MYLVKEPSIQTSKIFYLKRWNQTKMKSEDWTVNCVEFQFSINLDQVKTDCDIKVYRTK